MLIENTEELAQNKLLLLYLINTSDKALTKNIITEFILKYDYMNYFYLQQYLSELESSSFIELHKEYYSISEKGATALKYFIERVPEDFKSKVLSTFTKSPKTLKKEAEVTHEYYQKENNQYVVNLKLIEQEDTLFSLYLDVSSKDQAKLISKNWSNNPDKIYQEILASLLKNREK